MGLSSPIAREAHLPRYAFRKARTLPTIADKLPVYNSLPYRALRLSGNVLEGVFVRKFLDPHNLKPMRNTRVIKIDGQVDIDMAFRLTTAIRNIGANQFATYGDSHNKIYRELVNIKYGLQPDDPRYLKRKCNCKLVDEALRISTAKGEALFYNLGDVTSAIDYLMYNHMKFLNDPDTNREFRENHAPEGAALAVYQIRDLIPWSRGNIVYMPLVSISEVVVYLAMRNLNDKKISEVPEELVKSWAGQSHKADPERVRRIEEHIELIKHFLSDRPDLIKKLDGSFEDIAEVGREYLEVLKVKSRDLKSLKKEMDSILKKKVDITEVIVLKPGLLCEDNPRKPNPSLVFLGRELGAPDLSKNQLGAAYKFCRNAFDFRTPLMTIQYSDRTPLLTMAEYARLDDVKRKERQAIESALIKFFTLLYLPAISSSEKRALIELWNSLMKERNRA